MDDKGIIYTEGMRSYHELDYYHSQVSTELKIIQDGIRNYEV